MKPSSPMLRELTSLPIVALAMDVLNNNNESCDARKRELEKERSSGSADSGCFHSNGSNNDADQRNAINGASRLSKIGRRLRDSCRQLKAKSGNGANSDDFHSQKSAHESTRTKHYVAMDFSGRVGRIVESKEVRNCGKEGYAYFRRRICPKEAEQLLTQVQATAHLQQPWFHKDMSRDLAQRIIQAQNIDGTFLVRASSVSGGFVVSYGFNGRVFHAQILPDVESDAPNVYYTLDEGKTRFFDLLQLVDFYQLNRGNLQCKLVHMIVRKAPERHSSGSSNEAPDSPLSRSSCHASEASMDSHNNHNHEENNGNSNGVREEAMSSDEAVEKARLD